MNATVDLNRSKKWKIFAIVQNAVIIVLLCFFTLFAFWRLDFSRGSADFSSGMIILCLTVILAGLIFWFAVSQILLIILDKNDYIDLRKMFLLKLFLVSAFLIVCLIPFKDYVEGSRYWTSVLAMFADFRVYDYPVYMFVFFIILLAVCYSGIVPLIVGYMRELKNLERGENGSSACGGGNRFLSKIPYMAIAVLSVLLIICAIMLNAEIKSNEYSSYPLCSFSIIAIIVMCSGFLPLILKKALVIKEKSAEKTDLQAEFGEQPESAEAAVSAKENKFKLLQTALYVASCVISVLPVIIGIIRAL